MEIRFSGKNIGVTQGIKDHLCEKLERLTKYSPRLVSANAVFKKEKNICYAEITVLAKNFRAFGEGAERENIYTAIDQAYGRIEKQLKKFREKIKDHHKEHGEAAVPPKVKTARRILRKGRLEGERPEIVRLPSFASKPMSVEEASMQLGLTDDPFLVFLNARTSRPNVFIKLEDGNHGLIEPEF